MAIVKFVSDKDYQVFIDMEFVGKVTPNSMLKVTLETGGYFIQVKDQDGNRIKEYDLEIKSSDNQLLQKIDGINNNLDETLENLKNDSSLVFNCDRASFCHNGLYGFVDKKFNIVIPPVYYSVNEFADDKAFVVRDFPEGRKTTMIDSDGNMFFNRWFDYIGETDNTILLGIDNKIIVYSKTKYDKIAEFFNAGYDHKESLVPVYKKVGDYNFYGFIDFDGKEAIPFIFNNVGNFDKKGEADVVFLGREVKMNSTGYYKEREDGHYYKTSWNGDLQGLDGIFELMPNPCCYDTGETSWHFSPIWNDYKWIVRVITKDYNKRVIKEANFNCDYVLRAGTGYWICKQDGKVLVLIANIYNNGVEEFTFDADDVEPVFDINENLQGDDIITSRTFIVKKNNKYGVYNILGEVTIPIEYDEIIPYGPYEFAVRKAKKYGVFKDFKLTALIYDNVTEHINSNNVYNGLLLEKSGRYGLLKTWSTIPPIYNSIDSHGDRNIVSLNGKYGIIDDDNKEVLPIKYDMIVPLGDYYFKVKTEKGWSLGYIQHGIIYPNIFDDISFLSEHEQWLDIFLIKAKDNFGCINNKGELILPIDYDKVKLDSSFYTPRVISILTYKDGKVGFCDITYFYNDTYYCKRTGTYHFEYIYNVEPQFDECVLQRNKNAVLGNYYMHYAAVKKNGKWGILDQKPRRLTYYAITANIEDESQPNLIDLDYKYNSLEELENDADSEFQRRYDKYYQPWELHKDRSGKYWIIKKGAIIEEPSYTFPHK